MNLAQENLTDEEWVRSFPTVFILFDEVRGTPVLLSMLVLVFKSRKAGSTEPLPASRFELYVMATRLAIEQAVGESAGHGGLAP